jgi:lysozyme family protein
MQVRPGQEGVVAFYVKLLRKNQALYEAVGRDLGGIPWGFIGAIHGLECSFRLDQHLHNGDPLTAKTVHVPKGRPVAGTPPFAWRESAVDALKLRKLDRETDWSVPRMLYLFEGYNGFGYRKFGVNTPYLWSMSNHFEKGKFVADGKFDHNATSKQCGTAVMLKAVST